MTHQIVKNVLYYTYIPNITHLGCYTILPTVSTVISQVK